jgi:hypothetical protein
VRDKRLGNEFVKNVRFGCVQHRQPSPFGCSLSLILMCVYATACGNRTTVDAHFSGSSSSESDPEPEPEYGEEDEGVSITAYLNLQKTLARVTQERIKVRTTNAC